MAEAMAAEMEADAPLINPMSQENAPQGDAPIKIHDDPEDSTEIAEAIDRPDYLAAKFWNEKDGAADVEKLAKSYSELEKKFKAGKHKAPEEYDVSSLADQGLDSEDPTVAVYQDWAKENGISQDAFEDLAGRVLALSKDEQESLQYDQRAEMEKLGANASQKIEMTERLLMKSPLNNSQRESFAASLNNADAINAFLIYHQSITNENIPIKPAIQQESMTKDDLQSAIADPRWQTDAAWRGKMEKQWFQSQPKS
tara:strand:- start:9744 stop:10508 length:765 start_codon:yes stop_codon:yes gene_type:complete